MNACFRDMVQRVIGIEQAIRADTQIPRESLRARHCQVFNTPFLVVLSKTLPDRRGTLDPALVSDSLFVKSLWSKTLPSESSNSSSGVNPVMQ